MRVRRSFAGLWVFLTVFLLVACDPGPLTASLEAFAPGLPRDQTGLLADVQFSPISPPPTPTDPTSPLPTPTDPTSPLPTATTLPPLTPRPPAPGPSITPTPQRTHVSVTGGGWIASPPGAYTADPTLAGQASFSLVTMYRKGVALPVGSIQFHLAGARLQLHATTYESLQIEGARATFRGVGTLREAGGTGGRQVRFLVSVVDGQIDGSGLDRLRIKIWDPDAGSAVVYDSQLGAPDGAGPTTPLSGGSIVIHTEK